MALGIVSPNFPSVGAAAIPPVTQQPPTRSTERHGSLNAGGLAQTADSIDSCSCPPRTVVPVRQVALPFECTPANNAKMEEWLLHRFASFPRVTATTAASMRYYLTLSERNVVWMTPSTMTPGTDALVENH